MTTVLERIGQACMVLVAVLFCGAFVYFMFLLAQSGGR